MAKENKNIAAEVQEPIEGVATEAQATNPKQGEQAAVDAAESGESAAGGESAAPALSARETYRNRIKEDYPDLNMDDEDAYYEAANNRYDDYKNMREGLKKLNSMIDKNALFREMMVAASKGDENWNPFKWAVEEKGLDLKALAEDPEYAETFAQAQRDHLKKVADGEAMKKKAADNYAKSVEAIDAWAKENGISDEQKNDAWVKVEQMLTDANVGKVPVEVFALLVNGGKHDADVAQAAEQGYQEGLGKNVEDKLRRIPKPEKVVGRQAAEPQPKPKERNNNPFLA